MHVPWRRWLGRRVFGASLSALLASLVVMAVGVTAGALATNENYSCNPCGGGVARGNTNWVKNNEGIDYTRNGPCIYVTEYPGRRIIGDCVGGGTYKGTVCAGSEVRGYGEITSAYTDHMAGNQNNYKGCVG